MAGELQEASIGFNGEVWLYDGSALKELVQVVSFTLPPDTDSKIETTTLKAPGRRRTFTAGLIEDSSFQAVIRYRPLSDTDILIRAARTAKDTRACKLVIPQNGVPYAQVELSVKVIGYDKGELTVDGVMDATVTFEPQGVETYAAWVDPTP
jgi:hypothetical protein